MKNKFFYFIFLSFSLLLISCNEEGESFSLDYEKYTLDNGLEVILHRDTSDPIVAITTLFHVGSNREEPGRTGFAHFFEHMAFNDSENVPRGASRLMVPELGGERNGGTWNDGTVYYEVVPKDAFEKLLWMDSDRMGYMIKTVTKGALDREKQVVKNEKRERVDNNPYGHTYAVISKNLYPQGHPYSWTVIGELEDLQAATLDDVKEFYEKFYGANNATLAIAGDIDIEKTKILVENWFGEIRRGPEVEKMKPWTVTLDEKKSLFYEDNFAKLPELRMVFPAVEQYHPDGYALDILADILAGNKMSPFYEILIEERKLTPSVSARNSQSELAGDFTISVRANQGVDLDTVLAAIEAGFARFEKDGFENKDMQRSIAGLETALFSQIETVFNKSYNMAIYNTFTGDPAFITKMAEKYNAVTKEDVWRVYNKYIKGQNYLLTSFVPKGSPELAVTGAIPADIKEEQITEMAENEVVEVDEEAVYEKTPTKFDRSEPPLGETPVFKSPEIWKDRSVSGIDIYGINSTEVPLVTFNLTIEGGNWLNPIEKPGVVNLLTDLMMEGTVNKTKEELEEAIDLLGSTISVTYGREEFVIQGRSLTRNFEPTMALIEEILLEPRWDETEFERLKREMVTRLISAQANPNSIASVVNARLQYGKEHIFGLPSSGSIESVEEITIDDLKSFYYNNIVPSLAKFHVVGDLKKERVLSVLANFGSDWKNIDVDFPEYPLNPEGIPGKLYFVDVPGSKQSVLRVGKLIPSGMDEDYNNVSYANMLIGGGSYAKLFQKLRIEKGFTYGAYAYMGKTKEKSMYLAYSSVRSNATRPSLDIIRDLYQNYGSTFSEEDVSKVKNMVIKENTRNYESQSAKLGILRNLSKYNLPTNYIEEEQEELLAMDINDFKTIIEKYLKEEDLYYLVIGDAETQLDEVRGFGIGDPVLLDINGDPL